MLNSPARVAWAAAVSNVGSGAASPSAPGSRTAPGDDTAGPRRPDHRADVLLDRSPRRPSTARGPSSPTAGVILSPKYAPEITAPAVITGSRAEQRGERDERDAERRRGRPRAADGQPDEAADHDRATGRTRRLEHARAVVDDGRDRARHVPGADERTRPRAGCRSRPSPTRRRRRRPGSPDAAAPWPSRSASSPTTTALINSATWSGPPVASVPNSSTVVEIMHDEHADREQRLRERRGARRALGRPRVGGQVRDDRARRSGQTSASGSTRVPASTRRPPQLGERADRGALAGPLRRTRPRPRPWGPSTPPAKRQLVELGRRRRPDRRLLAGVPQSRVDRVDVGRHHEQVGLELLARAARSPGPCR